jgi:hypothetical protein
MSRIVDDEPPIKTGVASQAYKDGWERIFGEKETLACVTCGKEGRYLALFDQVLCCYCEPGTAR